MNKKTIIILVVACICVTALTLAGFMLLNNKKPDNNPEPNIVTPEPQPQQPVANKVPSKDLEQLVVRFYKEVFGWDVTVTVGEEKDNTIDMTAKVTEEYSEAMNIDMVTAIATLKDVDCKIDLFNCTYVKPYPEVKYEFENGKWLGVALVPMNNLLKFESKYFETETTYNYMRRLDLSTTTDENQKDNLFLFGRDPRVKVVVCKCTTANGTFEITEEAMDIAGEPMVVVTDKIGTEANICIKVSYPTVELLYPVVRDESGKLVVEGYNEIANLNL